MSTQSLMKQLALFLVLTLFIIQDVEAMDKKNKNAQKRLQERLVQGEKKTLEDYIQVIRELEVRKENAKKDIKTNKEDCVKYDRFNEVNKQLVQAENFNAEIWDQKYLKSEELLKEEEEN